MSRQHISVGDSELIIFGYLVAMIFKWSLIVMVWAVWGPILLTYRWWVGREPKVVSPYAEEWKAGYERARSHAA